MNLTIPTWIDAECLPTDCPMIPCDSCGSTEMLQWCQDLMYGGCASGQYMPAVTYHLAKATMADHGDDVLDYIEDRLGGADLASPQGMSWGAYCCYLVSIAVELWASEVEAQLEIWAAEGVDE